MNPHSSSTFSSVLHDHDIYPTGVDRYAFLPPLRDEHLLFVQHEQGGGVYPLLHFIISSFHLTHPRESAESLCLYHDGQASNSYVINVPAFTSRGLS